MKLVNFLFILMAVVFLFLLNRLLLPLGWLVDWPALVALFLILHNRPGQWSAVVILGLLLDALNGSPGVFLSSWLILAWCVRGLIAVVSLNHQIARIFLTLGVWLAYCLLVFTAAAALGRIFQQPAVVLIFKSSVWQTTAYALLNAGLLFLAGQIYNYYKKSRYVEIV